MSHTALVEAVNLAGGQGKLADRVNAAIRDLLNSEFYKDEEPPRPIRQGHVWKWLNDYKGPVPPAEYAIPIERCVNVSRHQLRSDIYGRPNGGVAA